MAHALYLSNYKCCDYVATLQNKQMGNSNPFWVVKIPATQMSAGIFFTARCIGQCLTLADTMFPGSFFLSDVPFEDLEEKKHGLRSRKSYHSRFKEHFANGMFNIHM